MNAKEAKELAISKQLGTDKALEQIKSAAGRGERSFLFDAYPLSDDAALQLMKKYHYKIGKHEDPIMGRVSYKIEW